MTGERGSIAVLVCTAAFILTLGALAVADAGAFLVARARAQTAADAAALAAVAAQAPVLGRGDDPVRAAQEEAAANGATLVECDCEVGASSATVAVAVEQPVSLLASWAGRSVRATASAAVADWIRSYTYD